MRFVIAVVVVGMVAAGCGGGEAGADAGSSRDAGGLDAPAIDARAGEDAAADAAAIDDAAIDDAAIDAASIDAARDDGGIDCSVIGCGAPADCGSECTEPCGCCPCADGEEQMRGGTTWVCTGGCFAPRGTGGEGSACASSSDCGAGLSCCYPCGIPGCTNICEPTCAPGTPGCADGCLLRP